MRARKLVNNIATASGEQSASVKLMTHATVGIHAIAARTNEQMDTTSKAMEELFSQLFNVDAVIRDLKIGTNEAAQF